MGSACSNGSARRRKEAAAQDAAERWPHLSERLEQHRGGINCLTLSEDHSLLVSGSEDGRVLLWSSQSTPVELLGTLSGHGGYVTHCAVHGNYVVTGSADGTLRKWSIVDAKCVHTFVGHGARVNRVLCTGDLVLSTSHDKTARAWRFNADLDEQEMEERRLLRQVENSGVCSQGKNGSKERSASQASVTGADEASTSSGFSEDADSGTPGRDGGHTKSVFPVIFVPADNLSDATSEDVVVTGSHDCTARTWGLFSGECIKILRGHSAPINAMAVDADGVYVFTGGGDGVIRSWHVRSGECLRVLTGHQGPIVCLLTHSKMLYSGSSDNTARAWVMEFGECTRVYRGHQHTVDCLCYHDRMRGEGKAVHRLIRRQPVRVGHDWRGGRDGVRRRRTGGRRAGGASRRQRGGQAGRQLPRAFHSRGLTPAHCVRSRRERGCLGRIRAFHSRGLTAAHCVRSRRERGCLGRIGADKNVSEQTDKCKREREREREIKLYWIHAIQVALVAGGIHHSPATATALSINWT
ncbi:uncharacterized protein LOC144156054 isoform X2 [Haemaphysalis longicornis]